MRRSIIALACTASACSAILGIGDLPSPGGIGPSAGDDSSTRADAFGSTDGPSDAGPPPVYGDVTDTAAWSKFVTTAAHPNSKNFGGLVFDGRYMYLIPTEFPVVTRYDTTAPFDFSTSWTAFDLNAAGVTPRLGYSGGVFDGRYVYFAPANDSGGAHSDVLRYDTQQAFASASSWTVFRPDSINAGARGFRGAVFSGRYVFFVPFFNSAGASGVAARYDTSAPFTSGSSWSIFDLSSLPVPSERGYSGAIFDGRYVSFVPRASSTAHGVVARVDSTASFTAPSSWSTFDLKPLSATLVGFLGGAFDGRFAYFVPYTQSTIARYDTTGTFASPASWTWFDTSGFGPDAGDEAYVGGVFDGRFVFFVPHGVGRRLLRHDTTLPFTQAAAWTPFDTTQVDRNAFGFYGGGFDGRYLYLATRIGSLAVRFDAKRPPSIPPSARGGSFY
jgi:hypothetical protein